MAKKSYRARKGFKGKKPRDDREGWTEVVRENEKWEAYYKAMNIIPEDEWDTFKKHCQENLPLTFRITGNRAHAKEVNDIFIDRHVKHLEGVEVDGQSISPRPIAHYPDGLGWQLDVGKTVIRKNPEFAKTQRFLVMETDVGNISRQEAVSMIPPLLMDVEPHHAVLDMCAAPGSKTAQLVEALHATDAAPTGFVLANDSDARRSHMLVHQVKRLNSANFMVVNHEAQLFPRVKLAGTLEYLKFDRILCDVPCSGDGTMRKNFNVWKDFTVNNGLGLHQLQASILYRGIQLLKKGGRLVYSTCSLSPVENEAVVAAALRKYGDQVRLVDCSDKLPGLKRRPGISTWKVFNKEMEERERGAEGVAETAFPPTEEEAEKFHLDRCIRVYPHLQNTGGFFITVFEKIEPDTGDKRPADDDEEASKKQRVEVQPKKQRLPRNANEEPFVFLDSDNEQLLKCIDFYDINSAFPRDCTLVRNATGEPARTIYYVAPIVRDMLNAPEQKLKFIHAGVRLFSAQRNDTGSCAWRVQYESLATIRQFLSSKRLVTGNLELLKILLSEAFPKIQTVKDDKIDPEFSEQLDKLEEGCVFLTIPREEGKEDLFLPLWKGRSNLNLMVNKKDGNELLYRVFDIHTDAKDAGKEVAHMKRVLAEKEARAAQAEASAEAEQEREAGGEATPEEEAEPKDEA